MPVREMGWGSFQAYTGQKVLEFQNNGNDTPEEQHLALPGVLVSVACGEEGGNCEKCFEGADSSVWSSLLNGHVV